MNSQKSNAGFSLFLNGCVYTMNPLQPQAKAVAVQGDRIVAVGDITTCRQACGQNTQEVDLRGGTLVPGFIDAHCHPVMMMFYEMNVSVLGIESLFSLQRTLKEAALKKKPGEWVVGLDFDEQILPGRSMPSRHDLDEACPDHPAILIKHDGHSILANTAAIRAVGIGRESPDPAGGVIDREADGHPAGPFREKAASLLSSAIPFPDSVTMEQAAKATFARISSKGITSIGGIFQTDEEGPAGQQGNFELMLFSTLLPLSTVNIHGMIIAKDGDKIDFALQSPLHENNGWGNKIGAVKLYADGSFASTTAAMFAPFNDHPESKGMLTESEEKLYQRMVLAHSHGLQIATHAIGDRGNRVTLELYKKLLTEYPRKDARPRLEHGSMLDGKSLELCRELGVVVVVQPLFLYSETHWIQSRIGAQRMEYTYPYRSILDAGIGLAASSDAPVESIDVLHGVQSCVTRYGLVPAQGINAHEALHAYTMGGAYAQFEEKIKGSIEVGKRADFALLSENPAKVPSDKIKEIGVMATYHSGRCVYKS